METTIKYIVKDKQAVARTILENLPEWFGIVSAREEYIADSAQQTMFAAFVPERNRKGYHRDSGYGSAERLSEIGNWKEAFCRSEILGSVARIFFHAGKNSTNGQIQGI